MNPLAIIAFDKSTVRTVDVQGFMHVPGCNISKATVNDYLGAEIPNWQQLNLEPGKIYSILRPADELAKATPTFNNLPLLDIHIEVSALDLEDPNIQKHIVGSTGSDAEFSAPYLQNSLVIWTAGAIAGIDTKEQTELSCAYRYDIDMTPGDLESKHYDGSMKNIVGNHVALVEEGRAGHDVVVADSKLVASDIVHHEQGHKDSEGNAAPWVIRSEKDGSILWSGISKEDAEKRLAHMHSFTKDGGPGSGPHEASDRANGATRYAKANNSTKNHMTASRLHSAAQKEHQMAGNAKEAEQHRTQAVRHANAARIAPVRDEDCIGSMTKDIAEREDVSTKSGITQYGKTEFADPKNHKYPIDTEAHVRAALSYWGRPKNKNKYSKEDATAITKKIQGAAKKFKIGEYADKGGKAHDSQESLMAKHKGKQLTPQGHAVRGVLTSYLAPRVAADKAIKPGEITSILRNVNPAHYAAQIPGLVGALKEKFKGRMAKDADLDIDELKELLESLEGGEDGSDDEDMDEDTGDMKLGKDDDDSADKKLVADDDDDDDDDDSKAGIKLMKMLSTYDIPEADLETINGLITALSQGGITKDDGDGDGDDSDGLLPAKKVGEGMQPQPITKPAMDAALKAHREKTISEVGARFQAGKEVAPYIGEVDVLAMDSAAAVYKMALDAKGIDTKGVHPSAFRAMLKMIPASTEKTIPVIAADASAISEFHKKYPAAAGVRKA